jgi:hypothetical protein
MSSIPSNAMPHAGPAAELDPSDEGETMTLARRVRNQADRVADLVRDNPRTAIAAGAAIAAGVAAAAAVPIVRANRRGAKSTAAPKAVAAKAPARKRTPKPKTSAAKKAPKKS